MIQESYDSRRRILKRDRGSRRVHRRRNMRDNRKVKRRLKTRRKNNTVEGEDLCPRLSYPQRRNHH